MKHNYILSLALTMLSSAFAASATSVSISGAALDESSPVVCTKLSDNLYEAFARLNGGQQLTASSDQGGQYSATVTGDGVYCVRVDVEASTLTLSEVTSFGYYYCWNGRSIANLNYVGGGKWVGAVDIPTGDDRYKFIMTVGGSTQYWGPTTSGLDYRPSQTSLGDAYYNMQRSTPASQWDEKWKVETAQEGTTQKVTVTLRGDVYTHSFAAADATPTALSATGSALVETGSVTFTQVSTSTFECFTTLKSGDITITDGALNYDITSGSIATTSGSIALDKEEGVYCINLDFTAGVASIKKVDSFGLFYCWDNKSIADMTYYGNGKWKGVFTCPSGDNRYKFVMKLDGTTQYWGPTTGGLDRTPTDANLGDVYYNMQRSTPASQWDEKWKFEDELKGQSTEVKVALSGDVYTHSLALYDSTTGIDTAVADAAALVSVNGNAVTFGDDAAVYAVTGVKVAQVAAGSTVVLARGLYVAAAGATVVKFIVE